MKTEANQPAPPPAPTSVTLHPLPAAEALPRFTITLDWFGAARAALFSDAHAAAGNFASLAPDSTTHDQRLKFDNSVLPPQPQIASADGRYLVTPIKSLDAELATHVKERARQMKNPVLYIHEALEKKSDAHEYTRTLSTIGDFTFFVRPLTQVKIDSDGHSVTSTPADEITADIQLHTLSWHRLLFLIDQKDAITSVSTLITESSLIAVGAYGGESYLSWQT